MCEWVQVVYNGCGHVDTLVLKWCENYGKNQQPCPARIVQRESRDGACNRHASGGGNGHRGPNSKADRDEKSESKTKSYPTKIANTSRSTENTLERKKITKSLKRPGVTTPLERLGNRTPSREESRRSQGYLCSDIGPRERLTPYDSPPLDSPIPLDAPPRLTVISRSSRLSESSSHRTAAEVLISSANSTQLLAQTPTSDRNVAGQDSTVFDDHIEPPFMSHRSRLGISSLRSILAELPQVEVPDGVNCRAIMDHVKKVVVGALSKDLQLISRKYCDYQNCGSQMLANAGIRFHMESIHKQERLQNILEYPLRHDFELHIKWNLMSYIRSQFATSETKIGDLVILIGTALCAQATTCSEYLRQTWPRCSELVLFVLQDISRLHNSRCGTGPFTKFSVLGLHVSLLQFEQLDQTLGVKESNYDKFTIWANGKLDLLIELAQALAWIGSTMSLSEDDGKLCYRKAICKPYACGVEITFQSVPVPREEERCWFPLFREASIAKGFPVLEREAGIGLEIPFKILTAIVGAQHAFEYNGGIVIKGFSSMLVPVKRTSDIIQWHLVSNSNSESRMAYREGVERCPQRALLEEVGFEDLRMTRHIVGWCKHITSTLGSPAVDYKRIEYSTAATYTGTLRLASGSLGFQQFGLAQLGFTLGPKEGVCHFQRSGRYRTIVAAAEKMPIVLYDTKERRGWLVSASQVILHVARHRLQLDLFEIDEAAAELFASESPKVPAKDELLKYSSVKLQTDEEYTFKDLVLNVWSYLEFLLDQEVNRIQAPGYQIRRSLQESIQGFEFKAIVEEHSPLSRKQVPIAKTCGGWPVLARDINALVLFANGYGDVLHPTEHESNVNLCNSWKKLPCSKDYLATTVKTLNDLYDVAGHQADHSYLTSTHLQWDRGKSSLFEPCSKPNEATCNCIRLQRIVSTSLFRRIVAPGNLIDDGGVIFGQCGFDFEDVKSLLGKRKLPSANEELQYDESTAISQLDSLDDASSVNSNNDTKALCSSDTTDGTGSSLTTYTTQERLTSQINDKDSEADRILSAKIDKSISFKELQEDSPKLNQKPRAKLTKTINEFQSKGTSSSDKIK